MGRGSLQLRGRPHSIVCWQRRKHSASSFDMAHSFESSGQRAPDPARCAPKRFYVSVTLAQPRMQCPGAKCRSACGWSGGSSMVSPCYLSLAAILLTASTISAQAVDEIQVYNAEIAKVGQWTFQLHNNYAFIGRKEPDFPGGLVRMPST